jgi:hypothetical protein
MFDPARDESSSLSFPQFTGRRAVGYNSLREGRTDYLSDGEVRSRTVLSFLRHLFVNLPRSPGQDLAKEG